MNFCLGVFRYREERDKDNETGLNRGRNRNVKLQCSIRDARSLSLDYLLTATCASSKDMSPSSAVLKLAQILPRLNSALLSNTMVRYHNEDKSPSLKLPKPPLRLGIVL